MALAVGQAQQDGCDRDIHDLLKADFSNAPLVTCADLVRAHLATAPLSDAQRQPRV